MPENTALWLTAKRAPLTVGPMIFEAFLPSALAEARFVAAPSPTLMGTGLAQIPAALERQRRGVSATKLVVTL